MKGEARTESDENGSRFLSDKVAQWYYSHGLFCSTYPICSITLAIAVVLLSCYPLLNIPLPGNFPIRVSSSINKDSLYIKQNEKANQSGTHENIFERGWDLINATEGVPPYSWTGTGPHVYIQQIVMKVGVLPWDPELFLTDAYRAPLYQVFRLLEDVTNHQDYKRTTLNQLCYHVESVKRKQKSFVSILPEYSCLILSPANFWQQNPNLFSEDADLLGTIFEHQNLQKGKISVAEMLFGMHLKDTGIKRYPLRNRRRILQYSLTLFLKHYDASFVSSLKAKLSKLYKLHSSHNSEIQDNSTITYIYYPGEFNILEFLPLSIAFLLLFLYIYFSMRKMELVKSKILLAFCAVITIFCSLLMSLGLCFFFGLAISMHSREIFPYLVILVGLENVLVLTKSIISTDIKLDVKIRVAQGLSKEGWSISKNLLTELTILTIGLCTFVPVIQELCIFAIVCLVCDFFLQMLFFVTVLAIDTRRVDFDPMTMAKYKNVHCPQPNKNIQYCISHSYKENSSKVLYERGIMKKLHRSKSHPRLNDITSFKSNFSVSNSNDKIPKRLRLVNIWARTRFFQRSFMMWMIVWISSIIYNSGVITHLFLTSHVDNDTAQSSNNQNMINLSTKLISNESSPYNAPIPQDTIANMAASPNGNVNDTDDLLKLKHTEYEPWTRLSSFHWQAVFNKYNTPISRKYLVVLPSIRISHVVNPNQAIALRHPKESKTQHFQWQNLAAALDPLDLSDDPVNAEQSAPFYPSSPMELLLMTILCFISVCVIAYGMVVLYHCICSRNYAEWRASWNENVTQMLSTQLVLDSAPIILRGHSHNIECVVADASHIASCCLTGQIKVWDNSNGQLIANIDRNSFFGLNQNILKYKNQDKGLHNFEHGNGSTNTESQLFKRHMNKEKLELPLNEKYAPQGEFNYMDRSELINECNDASHKPDKELYIPNITPVLNEINSGICTCAKKNHVKSSKFNISDCDSSMTNMTRFNYNMQYIQLENKNRDNRFFQQPNRISQIWCLDFVNNIIGIGCANGNLEFWEGTTGKFKCLYEDKKQVGVTSLKIIGDRVIVAKITGHLDFYFLKSYHSDQTTDWNFSSAYRRTHVRTGSAGSISNFTTNETAFGDIIECLLLVSVEAHQQPITVMDCQGNRVLTGSQDHTVKVFRIADNTCLSTLHGHFGPISCLALDYSQAMTAMSGSQDGHLCVWDLTTGACMYSPLAHDGGIEGLTYSDSYVITLGADDKLRTWDRFQGHLLMTINVMHTYSSGLVMLSQCLLVTARAGGLIVWDVRTGEAARQVIFSDRDNGSFVRHLLTDGRSVICDYGKELRLVRFPLLGDKSD